ncbi:MAG: surface-adhesin E family protein [Gemmatimonas sp.]
MRRFRCVVAFVACVALPSLTTVSHAQKLSKIGTTTVGTPVMLETRSVSRSNDIVTATVRAILQPPIKAPKGDYKSTRSIAMFNCIERTVATKERWFYYDEKGTREARHDKPGLPGFGPTTKGSLADVAMAYLCTAGGKAGAR